MKKSAIIAILVGLFVGIGGAVLYLIKKEPTIAPQVTQVETKVKLLDWKDPAGFTFQYPEGVKIDKHDEDKQNYAHVEMTHPSNPGLLIVWAKDTTAADVNAWVKTEKLFKDSSVFDTTLGGKPAKKILITAPTKKVIVGTIFDDILWYIETEPGEGTWWQETMDTIATSFTFTPLPGESSAGGEASYEEVAVDEEEVIE